MTILESMCVKIPILLRDLDIYNDILFDYYLKGNSVDEFLEILEKLKNDKDFYDEWSKNSDRGHKFYSRENVLKMWEDFYDRVYRETKDFKGKKKLKVKVKKKKRKLYKKLKFKKKDKKKNKKMEEWLKLKEKIMNEVEKQIDNFEKQSNDDDSLYMSFLQFFKKNK